MRILILSSRSEKHSANLGYNVISALRESGHEVDFNFAGANTVLEKLQNVGNSWFAQQVQRVIDKYTLGTWFAYVETKRDIMKVQDINSLLVMKQKCLFTK